MDAFALVNEEVLPSGLSWACGKVISIKRDTTPENRNIELSVIIKPGHDGFSYGFAVSKKTLKDEYVKSLVLNSLGKSICVNYSAGESSKFWLKAINLKL